MSCVYKTKEGETIQIQEYKIKLNIYPGSYCIQRKKKRIIDYITRFYRKERPNILQKYKIKKGWSNIDDLDFRFPLEVDERKFEEDLIYDLLEKYADLQEYGCQIKQNGKHLHFWKIMLMNVQKKCLKMEYIL